MKIQDNKEFNSLINGHHLNLKELIDGLDWIREAKSRIEMTKKLEHIFTYSETNIKYFSFLTSSFLDLLSTLKGLFNSESEWEEIYYSKAGFLTIYETINTYHSHQKEIKSFVDKDHSELLEEYKNLNKHLKKYKSIFKHQTEIGPIRNKTVGHFDKDFVQYYELIKKLNKHESVSAIESFLDFLKLLMIFVSKMADLMKLRTENDLAETKKQYFKK